MKAILRRVLAVVSVFAAGTVLGQPVPAMNLLIGNATANDAQAAVSDKLAELLTKYSNGRFKASARHGESLGNNAQMLAALQAGSIHARVFPVGFGSTVVPELSLWDMPFLLPGEASRVTAFAAQSKAAARMMELAEQKDMHVIGFHGIGLESILTKFPVNKIADLKGKKFRVIPSPARVGSYQDWGAVARPMEFSEVYTALQQGTLDGMENPPDVTYKMKHFEVAKYFTLTNHRTQVSIMVVSKKWYDGLPKDLKDVVTRAGKDTIAFADSVYTKAQQDGLNAMRKAITVTDMPAAELQKMKDAVRKGVWERMKADPQRGPIVKLLEEDVARFNKK